MTTETTAIKKLNNAIDWFDKQLSPLVANAFVDFFENEYQIRLFSVTTSEQIKHDVFSRGESYFVHKALINKHQSVITRLSSTMADIFLNDTFSSKSEKFNLMNLTDLEIKVLNSFANTLFEQIKTVFIPYKDLPKHIQNDKTNYNLGFFVKKEGGKSSKFIISIPRNALSPMPVTEIENFTFEHFENTKAPVNIITGSAKITLNDLKNLRLEDILLLDNSSINTVKIKAGKIEIPFKIVPNPLLYMDLNEKEHDIQGGSMSKNIWDDIPIEVSAEFHKVKMSLGELKKITNGMVVDLGNIFSNKISLVVEDKVVAKGDLVIINDKYGVKIDEIITETTETKPIEPEIKAANEVKIPEKTDVKQEIPQAEIEDEDFDYTNFEDDNN